MSSGKLQAHLTDTRHPHTTGRECFCSTEKHRLKKGDQDDRVKNNMGFRGFYHGAVLISNEPCYLIEHATSGRLYKLPMHCTDVVFGDNPYK